MEMLESWPASSHQAIPPDRKILMLRRSAIKPVSGDRRAEKAAYDRAKQIAWNRDRGQCQAASAFPEVPCAGRVDPHHVAPTGVWPELRCEPSNIKCCCRRHHDFIHDHPLEARERGLLR